MASAQQAASRLGELLTIILCRPRPSIFSRAPADLPGSWSFFSWGISHERAAGALRGEERPRGVDQAEDAGSVSLGTGAAISVARSEMPLRKRIRRQGQSRYGHGGRECLLRRDPPGKIPLRKSWWAPRASCHGPREAVEPEIVA